MLSRSIPSAPQAVAQPENNPGISLPVSPTAGVSRSRPLSKPKRASNVFMIGLALLFLGGFLVAAGWLFREPILNAVQTVKVMIPGLTKPAADVAQVPKVPEKTSPSKPGLPKAADGAKPGAQAPKVAEVSPTPKASGSFDPNEAPPQTGSPQPSPTIATASSENPVIRKAEPAMPAPSAGSAPQGDGVEVKPAMAESKTGTTSPLEAPAPPPEVAANSEIRLDDVTEEAKPAAEALKSFLKAASLQERLQYTLAADMMRPIMERYYSANSDGPIVVDAIALVRYDPKPQVGGGAHAVFGLESKTWEFPVPVMLEMSQGKFKVDWLSFVEFKDRLLEKFLAGYQDGPARFHVGITRTHYFGDKVPNASNKDVFRISPAPPNPFASVVFLEKDSELARELRDKIPWGSQVWAIVELEWMKLGPQNWVQLAAVPQLNWYSVPSAPKAMRGGSSSVADDVEVPTETQKAVPVGR